MFEVIEVNTIEDLQTYRLAWQELSSRGRSKRFQLSYQWLETYWKHLEQDRELKVLVAILAGRVVGILPLVKKKTDSRLGTIDVVTYPLDGWGSWYGPVGPNSAATLTAAMRHLSENSRGWDLLDLSYTDRDRLDLGRTVTAARNIGWSTLERTWEQIPYIELNGSWDQFLDHKKESVTQQILAAESELSSLGNVQLTHYRSDSGTPDELEQNLQSWKQIAEDQSEFPLIQEMAEAADDSQQLDLSVLTINNKPVAAAFGFYHSQGVEIVKSVTVSEQSSTIETVLLGRMLEQGMILGDESYEVCASCSLAESARKLWATKLLSSYRYTSSPVSHLRGMMLLKYHQATTPKVSQKRKLKPLPLAHSGQVDNKPCEKKEADKVDVPASGQSKKTSTSETPTLKIYG